MVIRLCKKIKIFALVFLVSSVLLFSCNEEKAGDDNIPYNDFIGLKEILQLNSDTMTPSVLWKQFVQGKNDNGPSDSFYIIIIKNMTLQDDSILKLNTDTTKIVNSQIHINRKKIKPWFPQDIALCFCDSPDLLYKRVQNKCYDIPTQLLKNKNLNGYYFIQNDYVFFYLYSH